jgi:hypothetical protein
VPAFNAYSYEHVPKFDPASLPLVRLARRYAAEGEFLVVWGSRSELYVDTNMLQGTRFGDSAALLEPTPQAEFFRRQYLRDLLAANPPLFFDTVAPSEPGSPDPRGHELFAELANVIAARYVLVTEVESIRVYVHNDRSSVGR